MYTINELLNLEQMENKQREPLLAEANKLSTRADELKTEMNMATISGDLKGYAKADTERRAILARLDHLYNKIAHPVKVDRENVLTAWADYAMDYNSAFLPKLAAYEAARRKLADQFVDLLQMQSEALQMRDKMNRLALELKGEKYWRGVIDEGLAPINALPATNKMTAKPYNGRQYVPVDTLYFALHGDIPAGKYPAAVGIMRQQPDPLRTESSNDHDMNVSLGLCF